MQDTHLVDTAKVTSYAKAFNHVISMDEVVSDSSYYRNSILTFKTASKDDTVEIVFNTEGGAAFTASVFIAAMRECQAKITGNLSGLCASAGTFIALNCDDWVVGDDLAFMVHTASWGGHDSSEKLRDHMTFMDNWNTDLLRRTYAGFLTEEEIEVMIAHGKEYWLNAEQTKQRLENFVQYHQNKQSEAIQQHFEQEIAEDDELLDKGLSYLLKNSLITEQDAATIKKTNDLLGDVFEKGLHEEVDVTTKENVTAPEDSFGSIELQDEAGNLYDLDYDMVEGKVEVFELTTIPHADALPLNLVYADEYYDVSKTVAKSFNISKSTNIKPENLMKKLIEYFEGVVMEHLDEDE